MVPLPSEVLSARKKLRVITLTLAFVPNVCVEVLPKLVILRVPTLLTEPQLAIIKFANFYLPWSKLASSYPLVAVGILPTAPNESTIEFILVLIVFPQGVRHIPHTRP